MTQDPIGTFLEMFENLLMKQQRTASLLFTSKKPVRLSIETAIEILAVNVDVLETVSDAISISQDVEDYYIRERMLTLCSEGVSWASLIVSALDITSALFVRHLQVEGASLTEILKDISQRMRGLYTSSLDLEDIQSKVEDIAKLLRHNIEITIKSYGKLV